MTTPTHIAFGEFLYLLLLTTTGIALSPINALTIGLSSVLPEVDTAASLPGRAVPFLAN